MMLAIHFCLSFASALTSYHSAWSIVHCMHILWYAVVEGIYDWLYWWTHGSCPVILQHKYSYRYLYAFHNAGWFHTLSSFMFIKALKISSVAGGCAMLLVTFTWLYIPAYIWPQYCIVIIFLPAKIVALLLPVSIDYLLALSLQRWSVVIARLLTIHLPRLA